MLELWDEVESCVLELGDDAGPCVALEDGLVPGDEAVPCVALEAGLDPGDEADP